jgi:putative nucleotidyltransferase with HDIG domain
VTRLSSRVTPFQGRNTSDGGFHPAGERRTPAIPPGRVMLDALWRIMATRDLATAEHALRVQRLAVAVAQEVGLDDGVIAAVTAAAPLHDIGKLAIPDSLLHRPGPLSREEYEIVQQHAAIGAEILSGIEGGAPLAEIVRHHHENWDGSGYPDNLRGQAIPIGARVLAVVDCYDALTSERPYRQPLEHSRALSMIVEGRGSVYEAEIVDAFVRVIRNHPCQRPPLRVI